MTGPQPSQAQKDAALDKAVRLFDDVLAYCREMPSKNARSYVYDMRPAIVREYRRILIEQLMNDAPTIAFTADRTPGGFAVPLVRMSHTSQA
jgi:hypothetical protein